MGLDQRTNAVARAPQGRQAFRVEILSGINLGGWIPTSVINTATSGAMSDSLSSMRKYFATTDFGHGGS